MESCNAHINAKNIYRESKKRPSWNACFSLWITLICNRNNGKWSFMIDFNLLGNIAITRYYRDYSKISLAFVVTTYVLLNTLLSYNFAVSNYAINGDYGDYLLVKEYLRSRARINQIHHLHWERFFLCRISSFFPFFFKLFNGDVIRHWYYKLNLIRDRHRDLHLLRKGEHSGLVDMSTCSVMPVSLQDILVNIRNFFLKYFWSLLKKKINKYKSLLHYAR